MKQREIIWYEDHLKGLVIMGYRGGKEYSMRLDDFQKEIMRRRLDSKNISPDKVLKFMIEEDQCVEFEEIIDESKRLCDKP